LKSSYITTSIENVPIFIKADNAEKEVEKYLKTAIKIVKHWFYHCFSLYIRGL
jgi:hypothetical protein